MPSPAHRTFSATYDTTTQVVTVAALVVFVAIVASTQSVAVGCLTAVLFAAAYAYSPGGYAIKERCLIVKRLVGNVRIPLDAVRQVRTAAPGDFRGCLRLWGSGGLFGYYGLFRTSKLGKSTWYVTNRRHVVVLIAGAKTVLLSPDDVDGFLAAIREVAPVPEGLAGEPLHTPLPAGNAGKVIGITVGVTVAVALAAFVVFAVTYAPGPPRTTLTHGTLTIHDRFYPVTLNAADVDVGHIRVVDLGTDRDWCPTARTNGFANSHYRSGWFRVVNGRKVRLYRADGLRLVLLPPKGDGAPVLLEVTEPEKFIDQVRRDWAGGL